ncbi:hypothetical protein [Psychrobacter sp. FDAARGOS_221]|uniref:hypothetical protein n=1 Tax=Psychrobacter sp. FDAARGOS_221 TaxID=1975705 RepID=UPI000BB59F06|nr:hypothetical protein [Psychrobacter sp. FDAARGOS_221]PNK59802.1 hypothetical protein A6J60_002175 [Psychrobacter sp. FDAARGOS_221]
MPYILALLKKSLLTTWFLLKIIVPMMFISRIMVLTGVADWLSRILAIPLSAMGLPGEAGLIWAVTILTNIYGGIGVLATLLPSDGLTVGQLSILGSAMLFAHAIPVEQAVVKVAGASALFTGALRLFSAIVYGIGANFIFKFFDIMQDPVTITWLPEASTDDSWLHWLQSIAELIVMIFAILTALNFVMDVLERIGFIRWLSRRLEPFLRLTGQNPELAPMTTIGLLLGLSYGGGLIIQKVREVSYSKRDLFMSLSCLSIMHSLIEDTLLILLLGADIWVILVGRVAFAVVLLILLAKTTDRFFYKDKVQVAKL